MQRERLMLPILNSDLPARTGQKPAKDPIEPQTESADCRCSLFQEHPKSNHNLSFTGVWSEATDSRVAAGRPRAAVRCPRSIDAVTTIHAAKRFGAKRQDREKPSTGCGRPRAAVRCPRSIDAVTTHSRCKAVWSEATGLNTQKNAPAEAGALK